MPPAAGFPAPAPVKVTGSGPQANAPKSVGSQTIPPKGQAPPTVSGKERSTVHPDKGASATDKTASSADKSAPVKKHASPEKVTASPKPPQAPDLGKTALPTSGDLTDITVPKLLKQLKAAQVTARLEFADDPLTAIVYLEDGKPIEAWFGELKGDSALLEILLWTSGKYTLTIGMTATNRNVKTSPEVLVEHNKNIASLLEELAGEGLTATSTFAPSNPLLSSEDFDRLATPDAPMELEKLARLYVKLDGKKTIADLNELQVLPRPELVQAIHHLYFNSIIDIVDPTEKRKELVVTPKEIDNAAIQSVMTSLRRIDTGLFIYPAFLYFLQEEFFRIYRAKSSMTVLIFEMRELSAADGLVRRVPLSSDAIADATMRISSCKRHTDVVAHYEQHDFAILLPSTGSGGTKVFANKIIKALTESPLAGTEGKKLSFSFGSASMPEDFKELSMLLGAAEMAMSFARQRGKPLVLFREMEI
jgi:GGDEF domain-containing protein